MIELLQIAFLMWSKWTVSKILHQVPLDAKTEMTVACKSRSLLQNHYQIQ